MSTPPVGGALETRRSRSVFFGLCIVECDVNILYITFLRHSRTRNVEGHTFPHCLTCGFIHIKQHATFGSSNVSLV